jgi:hypothetical protein
MNRLISEGPFPFWGCSKKDELTTLSVKKSREHGPNDIPEFRIVEETLMSKLKARPQPVWKIAFAGAVGGQTLTGLPAFERLREKIPGLKIWPFETPFGRLDSAALDEARVVVAEIFPTAHAAKAEISEVRDEAQVRGVTEWLGERDANGKLGSLFGTDVALTDSQKAKIATEEGWILGI